MTETAVDVNDAPVGTEANEAEAPKELVFQNELHHLAFEQIKQYVSERNAIVGRLNAAQGDRVSLTEQIKNESTDPAIVAAREAVAEAQEALDALVNPLVEQAITDASGSTDDLEKALSDLDGKLKPAVTFFKKAFEGDPTVEALPTQDRLKGATVGRAGSGTRRIRGFNVIVTVDGKTKEFENFAGAAKYLEIDTSDLQKLFFESVGKGMDVKISDLPDEQRFVINYTEVDEDGETEVEKEAIVKAYRTGESNGSDESGKDDENSSESSEPAAVDLSEPEVGSTDSGPTEVNLEEI